MKVSVIIPSLNPDEKLQCVVDSLVDYGFDDIIIVNDGSDNEHLRPFEILSDYEQCTVIGYDINKGKGRALKTAFEYCIKNRPDIDGVVTVDGDNQHRAADIKACCEEMDRYKDSVVLGVRDFSGSNVPYKSRFGNNMTSFVFKFACGLNISDTQTGLRAIPAKYLELFTKIKGERFEYETNMLLELKNNNIGYREVKIETVYIDENASTHFNPIKDSLKIYGVIFKFLFSSFASSLIDLGIFTLIGSLLLGVLSDSRRIFAATCAARVISSLFNYTFNRKAVFKSKSGIRSTMVRYYILCVCQLCVSYALVYAVTELFMLNMFLTVIAKALIDVCLFVISFQIQRRWVFK